MIGSVRVVARRATLDTRMSVGGLQIQGVTVIAKLGFVFLESQNSNQAMWLVAGSAAAVLQNSMGPANAHSDIFVTVLAGTAGRKAATALELGIG